MAGRRQLLGARGEDAAAAHLEGRGYEILCRNWRTRAGEIDIVARDGPTVVVVEVKLRHEPFDGLEAVDRRKQRRIARVAWHFLARERLLDRPVRFDVIAVDGGTLACTHVRNAFDCDLGY